MKWGDWGTNAHLRTGVGSYTFEKRSLLVADSVINSVDWLWITSKREVRTHPLRYLKVNE